MSNNSGSLNVLLVDDEVAILNLLCRVLTISGHSVSAKRCVAEGIEEFDRMLTVQKRPFDVVVVDWNLGHPGGPTEPHGDQMLRHVRERASATRVILMSADHLSHSVIEQFDDCLRKPVTVDQFLAAISAPR